MKRTLLATLVALCSSVGLSAQGTGEPQPIMTVTLLGTGVPLLDPAAYLASGQVTAGLLVVAGAERMLFDCGQGIITRLLQSGGPSASPNVAVDRVFISHLHSDHYADLPALYNFAWLYRDGDPLEVWGPGPGPNSPFGMGSMMPLLRAVDDADIYIRCCLFTLFTFDAGGENTIVTELKPGVVYKSNGVTVTAFLVNHMPVNPAYGFRVDYQGHSFVYSGDTTYDPTTQLTQMATGVDLLAHEIYGFDQATSPEVFAYHTTPEDLAKLLTVAQPKLTALTHQAIPPGTTGEDLVVRIKDAGYNGPVQLGADLMSFDIFPNFVAINNPVTTPSVRRPSNRSALPFGALPPEVKALRPAGP
ncbi:MAG TPA: MBL fold metallo-hydrolase [Bryobacteraceae bacterium]|jgi:ribonuclease Z|nr:MBL fold metallo-hydrolase [Bryobacteraceae bacterium]